MPLMLCTGPETYYLVVAGYDGAAGNFTLSVTCP